jgi:amino acid adenylation domain-containing protein/thioester reductase-like protein
VTASDEFTVVVNDLGMHSVWQAGAKMPPGWRRQSAVVTKSECLALIERSWQDMAPASTGAWGEAHVSAPVHEQFAEQAARRPGAPAVIAGRARVSYGDLEASANRLAHYLAEAGTGPEAVVGVYLERGPDVIRSILAIMKAGACYLPLDLSLPVERLAGICAQVRPAAVITAGDGQFPVPGPRLVPLGELDDELARRPATAPAVRPAPGNVCYVIHTSGSTGDPKAVAVSYGSLACTIPELDHEYQIGPSDRVAQLASLAFDTSMEQIFVALTRGATLILPPPTTMAPSELLRGIERRHVTVIDLTPAYWHQLLALAEPADQRLRSVRLMITGGAQADADDCGAALQAAPWARLLNAYGLTETTITSTLYDVGAGPAAADPAAVVPVGRPVGHARIMILDDRLRPLAAGRSGEICISGCQLARGYLGRPALTAQRFVPDPEGEPGARMYRTGDLGRWVPGRGILEVTGRMDRQLKVRGFRVEPGEIENVLAGHPDISQVSVTATASASGDTRLVAYYTPSQVSAAAGTPHHPPAATLRRYLLDRLPGYMIPSAFIPRQHLPVGPEPGDGHPPREQADSRRADSRKADSRRIVERHTPTQAGIAALWARLLGREHVGLDDDFFQLGGNSLLAAEMLAHTRAIFGLPPESARPLTRGLLREPTLRAFAAAARAARAGRLDPDGGQQDTDFAGEAKLHVTIHRHGAASRPPRWHAPREVLLTGATGFLGAHLLSELLAATDARVWCLVRAQGDADARARIAAAAARYELPAPPDDRVVPMTGDLAEPGLGLSPEAFRELARDIDVIYHVGAQVNFVYPYQALRAANVGGTREVIRLAGESRAIPVHYVSTTAVLAGLGVSGVREATEETPLGHPEQLRMGYVETKYVAEELLRNASRGGLPVAIYRPLDIVGSLATGAWSTSTEMAAFIRFMADTGLAPDIELPLDFVAADVCARAIRHISVTEEAAGRVYHLASPGNTTLRSLTGRMRRRGYKIKEIPFDSWARALAREAARDASHPMTAFLPLFVDRDADSGLTVAEMYLGHIFPAYSRANTERALRGTDIAFESADGQLLDRNVDRLMRTGYLPDPPGGRLADAG